jgi:ApaG protein
MLTVLCRISPPVAVATKNWQRWITRKPLIGERQFAQIELRAARAPHDPRVCAIGTKTNARVSRLPGPARIVHHESMFISEALTRGVRVRVQSEYSADQSAPSKNQWFFLYTVTISNEGAETVQLLTRHWIITDGTGHIEEVRGPGVVGKQPTIKPGESFEYTSGCPLSTPFGVMEGTYQMVTQSGERFEAKIAPFTLSEPYTVH